MSNPPRPISFIDLAAQRRRLGTRIDDAIGRVLDHGQYIMGPEVGALERQLTEFCGARFAVGCSSGTDALMLPMMAKKIGPGDAVFVPALTFTATIEVPALLGAAPVIVDVDPVSFNMDPASLDAAIATARGQGLHPVGVVPVDLFGLPADYAALGAIAERHGMWVLADSAQGFGAAQNGRKVGTLAAMTATSFFPAKPLGCYGDGGCLFTDDAELAAVARSLLAHGKGDDKYDTVRIGINARLDTLQAAILIEKLAIFADEVERRNQVAERYQRLLGDLVETPQVPAGCRSVWAQYTIRIDRRDELARRLKALGVPTAVYYPRAMTQQPAYRHCLTVAGGAPVAEALVERVLSLPMHPYLEADDQDYIADAIRRSLPGL
jgi:dTDP-4-amino-4,6-dideoxygalactose transaminase